MWLSSLPLYLLFCLLLICVTALKRTIALKMLRFGIGITGSLTVAAVLYNLLMLPGLFMHEAAHWLVALLVGLRPSHFTLWPQVYYEGVVFGSVSHRSGDVVRNSLVAAAPFFVGFFLLAPLGKQLATGSAPSLLLLYLIFTLVNGMIPSSSDRETFQPLASFLVWATLLYLAMGLPLQPTAQLLQTLIDPIQAVLNALLVALLLDVAAWFVLGVLAAFFGGR